MLVLKQAKNLKALGSLSWSLAKGKETLGGAEKHYPGVIGNQTSENKEV